MCSNLLLISSGPLTQLLCNKFHFVLRWTSNILSIFKVGFLHLKKNCSLSHILNFRLYMPVSITIINDLSYIMVTINSSVNFIIYCFLGESFRKEMKKMAKESREQFQKWLLKVFRCSVMHLIFLNISFFTG